MEDNTAIDAIEEVILEAVYNEENTVISNHDIAKAVFDAGYRLDPYPNGKSKPELIARIEAVEAERDKTRNLLRAEHEKIMKATYWNSKRDVDCYEHWLVLHEKTCPVCTFLAETSTVKP